MNKHIVEQEFSISKEMRRKLTNNFSCVLWLTGLSGSGKSTLAKEIEKRLYDLGVLTYILDGDNIRHGLNNDLGFSQKDREENIRRIGEVSKLFVDSGAIVISAFISPYQRDREFVRKLVQEGEFVEVYVKCPIEVCENRDVKGLYKKAREGVIKGFTGIDDPYEEPTSPEIILETDNCLVDECVDSVIAYLKEKKIIGEKLK